MTGTDPSARDGRRLGALLAVMVAAAGLSLLTGNGHIGFPGDSQARWIILTEIRLPRALLGLLVGGSLGLAGAVLQGYLRNPLAEPGLIGVSSSGALGAVLAIHLGLAAQWSWSLPLGGLAGAAAATCAVIGLAGLRAGPVALVLAGVAVSSLATAGISLALNLSANPFAAAESVFWMMGSLADRSILQLTIAAPLILAGTLLLARVGRALDALALGDDTAASLGVDLARKRIEIVLGVALVVGASTAVTGIIGFVGLVVPHVLRSTFGHQPSRLLAASFLAGAALLLAADVLLRIVSPVVELRIGVLTALIGAPFFLWLVLRMQKDLEP